MTLKKRLTSVSLLLTLLPALLCVPSSLAQERPRGPITEMGEINGARFQIDIPPNWNGGLVMWAHGFRPAGTTYRLPNDPVAQGQTGASGGEYTKAFLTMGYAVAQSAFSVQGFALREGALDTEALRQYFNRKYGQTYPTIVAGNHMGGLITYDLIERFPESYDGALALGGTAEPRLEFVKRRIFDLRLLFDYYIPGLPGSVVEFPPGLTHAGIMEQAKGLMKQKPEETKLLLRMFKIRNEDGLARCLATYTLILQDLYQNRAKGNAFDNRNTVYFGSDDDARLNRAIRRFKSDPKAVEYMRQWSTPTGRISDPVLALNPIGDPVVPIESASYYAEATGRAGTSHLFALIWVEAPWAIYQVEQVKRALELLTDWITLKKRPEPGELKVSATAKK